MKALATIAQQNAAFDKVFPEIEILIEQYVPPFFQSAVIEKLHSPQGRALILKLIVDGLNAAETAA
jgi:hypothetical protein